jgi:hypothetical protein
MVAVHPTNPSIPQEEILEALRNIIEGIKQHGFPDQPMVLSKKFDA